MPLRRQKQPPQRQRHPDPAVELQLLRILDLRATVDRRAQMIADYRYQIGRFGVEARGDSNKDRVKLHNTRANELDARIEELEKEIETIGGRIAILQSELDPADLAFLW